MKFLFVLLCMLISAIRLTAQVPRISTEPLPISDSFTAMTAKGKDVYVLAVTKAPTAGIPGKAVLTKFDGGQWRQIPVVRFENNNPDTLTLSTSIGHTVIDRSGSLWISAGIKGLWKYNGVQWEKFLLNDNVATERIYGALTCDSTGNIWVMTQIYGVNEQSALLRFDGTDFRVIEKSPSFISFGGIGGGQSIVTRADGTVVYYYTRSVSKSSTDTTRAELFFYKNGQIDSSMAQAYDLTPYPKRINSITANGDNSLFFNYARRTSMVNGSQITFGGGLSVLNSNGTWKHFLTTDGLPKAPHYSNLPGNVFGAAQDRKGAWWFGGENSIFTLKNQEIRALQWKEIYQNATLYKQAQAPEQQVEMHFNGMWDTTLSLRPEFYQVASTDDGSIWYMTGPYILRIMTEPTTVKDEQIPSMKINIYPQPAQAQITIELPQHKNDISLRLLTIHGKEVNIQSYSEYGNYHVLVEKLSAGVYLLEIRSGDAISIKPIYIIR